MSGECSVAVQSHEYTDNDNMFVGERFPTEQTMRRFNFKVFS